MAAERCGGERESEKQREREREASKRERETETREREIEKLIKHYMRGGEDKERQRSKEMHRNEEKE